MTTPPPAQPRRLHRAVILLVLIVASVAWLGFSIAGAVTRLDGRAVTALVFVLVSAVLAGVAFSWGRYYR